MEHSPKSGRKTSERPELLNAQALQRRGTVHGFRRFQGFIIHASLLHSAYGYHYCTCGFFKTWDNVIQDIHDALSVKLPEWYRCEKRHLEDPLTGQKHDKSIT